MRATYTSDAGTLPAAEADAAGHFDEYFAGRPWRWVTANAGVTHRPRNANRETLFIGWGTDFVAEAQLTNQDEILRGLSTDDR